MNTLLIINWGHVWMVTGMGFALVFCLLVVLIFILKGFGALMQKKPATVASAPQKEQSSKPQIKEEKDMAINSNMTAAIAMALHLSYFGGMHDEEPTHITVNLRPTQWNNKMYGMNNLIR